MSNTGAHESTYWVYASLIFNTSNAPTSNYSQMKSIAAHEIGHAIGLAHVYDRGCFMYPYYDLCVADSPTADEVAGAKSIYP